MPSKVLILSLFALAACTTDGDPVESGSTGDSDGGTSAGSMSSTTAGSMSASSTSAGTNSSTSASTSAGPSSESADSGSGDSGTDVTGHSSLTMTGSGDTGSGSASSGTVECIAMAMACGEEVPGECCEGTQCIENGLAPTCQRCGVADDPCDPVAAPCCDDLECVMENPGGAGTCVEP